MSECMAVKRGGGEKIDNGFYAMESGFKKYQSVSRSVPSGGTYKTYYPVGGMYSDHVNSNYYTPIWVAVSMDGETGDRDLEKQSFSITAVLFPGKTVKMQLLKTLWVEMTFMEDFNVHVIWRNAHAQYYAMVPEMYMDFTIVNVKLK